MWLIPQLEKYRRDKKLDNGVWSGKSRWDNSEDVIMASIMRIIDELASLHLILK